MADLLAFVCGVFCEFVTFPLVSWVRCGTWLYRFLIFATLLLCTDTLLGRGNNLIRFWRPWLISRSQLHFEMSKIWFQCVIFWTNRWKLNKLEKIHCWEKRKSSSDFNELTLNFKVTPVQNRVSVRYLLNQWMDFDQTCIGTLLGGGYELTRFWWPWPNFQGQISTLKCPK